MLSCRALANLTEQFLSLCTSKGGGQENFIPLMPQPVQSMEMPSAVKGSERVTGRGTIAGEPSQTDERFHL